MKKLYTTVLSVLAAGSIFTAAAQQQPNNGGFENWDNEPEPVNWNNMTTGNLCFLCGFGSSQRVFEDNSEVRTGNASARIESTNAAGTLVNGTMTTGQIVAPSTTPSEGYSITLRNNADFNHPFTDEPDSLVFWAKYNVTDASDSASISVILHDDFDMREPGGDVSHIVAAARKRFQTGGTAEWVRISAPFDYSAGTSTSPVAYALMTFTSSYTPGVGNSSAKLWVDDFEFIYNSPVTSVEELAFEASVYPNPTNDGRLTVALGSEMRNGMVTVLNVMGQTVGQFNFMNDNQINVQIDQPAGMYFLSIRTEDGQATTLRVLKN
ncbi:MAG: T9SS type A sorting domain-containing protein [Flavobacteriales bacterium]|nr:T9SS type A sorting domain-containing protein [Flavobacteriales bacterium]